MGSMATEQTALTSPSDAVAQEQQDYGDAVHLITLMVLPMTLQATFELGVFDILAKAGDGAKLSAAQIADEITNRNGHAGWMVDRMLRLLASHSVVGCSVGLDNEDGRMERMYSLNNVSKYYVRNEDGGSMAFNLSLIQDKVFLHSWSELKNAVIEGGVPFQRAHGVHAFEYCSVDPRFNQILNAAMKNHTAMFIKKIVKSYKGFANIKQLVDVGGGLGVSLQIITSTYPSIKGINFDLPHVIQNAPSYLGVEHVGGDMFVEVPKGDAIFMKWILHN